MGLRATLQAAASAAFDAFDDVPVSVTLVSEVSTHDPNTATNTKVSTQYTIDQMALVRFTREQIGAPLQGERGALLSNRTPIEASDIKGIFQQTELPTGVEPRHKDRVLADGTSWGVMGVAKDPASVIWILQLRAR